jgi:hypothetical protein
MAQQAQRLRTSEQAYGPRLRPPMAHAVPRKAAMAAPTSATHAQIKKRSNVTEPICAGPSAAIVAVNVAMVTSAGALRDPAARGASLVNAAPSSRGLAPSDVPRPRQRVAATKPLIRRGGTTVWTIAMRTGLRAA